MSHYDHYKRRQSNDRDRYYDYQPKARSKVMGVCAGIAKQFGWDVTVVRIVAVVGLCVFTGPVLLSYLIAGALFY